DREKNGRSNQCAQAARSSERADEGEWWLNQRERYEQKRKNPDARRLSASFNRRSHSQVFLGIEASREPELSLPDFSCSHRDEPQSPSPCRRFWNRCGQFSWMKSGKRGNESPRPFYGPRLCVWKWVLVFPISDSSWRTC